MTFFRLHAVNGIFFDFIYLYTFPKPDLTKSRLKQPTFFEISFGRGIVPALGKGITPKYPPRPEQYPDDRAVIVDTLEGILGTGGAVQTGVFGKMLLIKQDHAHTKHFRVRSENLFS